MAEVGLHRSGEPCDSLLALALRGYYMRIRTRRGTKDARTATARKLAELAWTVCTQKRPYVECSKERPT